MKYNCENVSVVLVVYRRPVHTQRVLTAIRESNIKNLAIYMDAPSCNEVRERQDELVKIIRNIDWADCRFIRRKEQLRLAKSIVSAVTEELQKYEQIILLEDDCVPQKCFFEFMFSSLEKYKEDKKVRSVCGYQLPIADFRSNSVDGVLIRRFMPWGWATWRDRWNDYDVNLERIVNLMRNHDIFDNIPHDLKRYSLDKDIINGKNDIWSTHWVLLHYLTETYALLPSISLIENIGFDGTGVHCVETSAFKIKKIENEKRVINLHPEITLNDAYDKKVQEYLEIHSQNIM